MSDTPNLTLPYLAAAQAQKHVTHNEALSMIDGLTHLAVISRVLAAPPAAPVDGDRYLVPAGATGAWAAHTGQIALRMEGAWRYFTPREGWVMWVADEDAQLTYNGSAWISGSVPVSLQNLSMVGINATADLTNRLSVNSAAVLFNHAGSSTQMKFNKNAVADSASILFQTGFSGRAEIGTAGDDNFHFKVSANGSAFKESIILNAATGLAVVKNNALLEPQSADPATPVDGQLWYNSTTGKFRARQNGTSVDVIGAGGGGATWGVIMGTLSAQADLQTVLNGKLEASAISSFGATLVDDADAAAARTTLGLGTAATAASSAFAAAAHSHTSANITDFAAAADSRIGAASIGAFSDVVISAPSSGQVLKYNGSQWINDADATGSSAASYTRNARWCVNGGAATISLVDAAAISATGTATAVTQTTSGIVAQVARIQYLVTVAATTAVAGWRATIAQWWRGNAAGLGGFRYRCLWGNATGAAVATNRAFVGLSASTAAPSDAEPSSLLNIAGMGWDAADANVQIFTNDGTGVATKIDLGAGFPVPTVDNSEFYFIELKCEPNAATIDYAVTRLATGATASGSLSADLPGNNTMLTHRGYMSVGGTSGVIGISLSYIEIGSNY